MAKSKIIDVQGNGTFKDMFIFEITLENGDVGNIYRKTDEAKVAVAEEIEYDLKPSGTLKIITDYNRGQPTESDRMTKADWEEKANKKSDIIAKQVALKCAIEWSDSTISSIDKTLKYATTFYEWLMDDITKNQDEPF